MSRIAFLGSGGFGIALAILAQKQGHEVIVWSAFEEEIALLKRDREHKKLLPGVKIDESIEFVTDISAIAGSEFVFFAIPSAFVRKIARLSSPYISKETIVVNVGKGLEGGSLKRLSAVLGEELRDSPIVILSGPSHAEEVALDMPTTVVAACERREYAERVQEEISGAAFRVYVSDDVIGCELGGALKNIIALCAGICDGMGYGDNTKAALMTRGITEITRLGVALGANFDTFAGLTGIGDLIVTCTSMHSRNRRAGILIGQGVAPADAVAKIGTVEGYSCAKAAWELCTKVGIDMPITEQLYSILYDGKDVKQALSALMERPRKAESESVFTK